MRNVNKIAQAEVARILGPMDLDGKYIWTMSSVDIDAVRDLRLTDIKKNRRLAGQIEKKVDGLQRDWISALVAFVNHFWKTNNNKEMTENIKIKRNIDPGWISSLFVQLHGSIYCWKMDRKDIADATKLVKELVCCLLV